MTRIATLAALAVLIAAPASAQSMHVSKVGKTPEQLHSDIVKAAWKVCAMATNNEIFRSSGSTASCARRTIAATVAGVPELAGLKATEVAAR